MSLFTLTDINSTAADGRSGKPNKDGKYIIEITPNTGIGDNFRVAPDWTEIEFTVRGNFRLTDTSPAKPYVSPRFKIIRAVQVPTITLKDPTWQAEMESGKTITNSPYAVDDFSHLRLAKACSP